MTRHPRIGRTAGRLLLATLAATFVTTIVLGSPADAHATLVTSIPADGSTVQQQPTAVRLTFDEPVRPVPSSVKVISTADGSRADTGDPRQSPDGTSLILTLRSDLPSGSYTAIWRVVSADTHVVTGSITFGLRSDPLAPPATPAEHTGQLDIADDAAQGLLYLGIVLLIGVSVATRILWPWAAEMPRIRGTVWTGWACMTAATVASLLLAGPRDDNGSWGAVLRLRGLGQTLASDTGQRLLARLALLMLALLMLALLMLALPLAAPPRRQRRWRTTAGTAVAVLLLLATALTGHESVGDQVTLALASAVAHLAAMAVWLGGLVVLGLAVLPDLRAGGDRVSIRRLRQWPYVAYVSVAVLVVTGEYQAARQISPVQALWSTSYGIILLVKVAIVAAILAAALVAQRQVLAMAPDAPTPRMRAARSVRVELVLAVAVLAVTALLGSQPPARTSYGPAVDLTVPAGPDRAHVHIDTTRRGRQNLTVVLTTAAGQPVPTQSVTARLSSASVAALNARVVKDNPAGTRWHCDIAVPLPGIWTVSLTVTVSTFDAYTTGFTYQVW